MCNTVLGKLLRMITQATSCRVMRISMTTGLLQVSFLFLLAGMPNFQRGILQAMAAGTACNYSQPQFCGSLSIPYPFGMSPECGLPHYRISCKPNASYGDGDLAFLQIGTPSTPELQVLEFSINTLIVNSTYLKAMPVNCSTNWELYGHAELELSEHGPFVLGASNIFVVIGCSAEGSCNTTDTNNEIDNISCGSSCYNQFTVPYCNDYACCINALPPGTRRLQLQGKGVNYKDFPNVCGFSTVLSPPTYNPQAQQGIFAAGTYGLSISWALQSIQNCSTAKQGPQNIYACSDEADCIDGDNIEGYTCNCMQGYRGDGYKAGLGCKDIDECKEQTDGCEKPPLGVCTNTIGSYSCRCTSGVGSGLPGNCTIPNHSKNVLVPAVLGGVVGAAALTVLFIFTCISRRAYQRRKEREENFRRIGGDQLASFLFSERELIKATKGFSDDHVLGEGGFGKVYWGKLTKEQGAMSRVAIKRAKPKAVEEQVAQMQSFVREILLLSKTTHKNVVRLLGCCVETSVPLLVYEFVEKGTLRDYLKTPSRDIIFQGETVRSGSSLWAWRLHIATKTAEALSYLHGMSEPIFHLDMKSTNILIDKHYNPKVADFGLSCFLTSDATHLTNQVPAGTFGYVDPEYYHSLRVTDKCDVYSFGVILLELISGMPASQGSLGAVLAHHFRTDVDMKEEIAKHIKQIPSFIDMRLGTDADVVRCMHSMAELARRCVDVKGTDRPSMQDVVKELQQLQSNNAGKPRRKGAEGVALDVDNLVGLQELYGAGNSNEREARASVFDDKWISLDQSASSSSLYSTPRQPPSGHSFRSTSASIDSHSAAIELRQFSS